jgi:hypothetical protein
MVVGSIGVVGVAGTIDQQTSCRHQNMAAALRSIHTNLRHNSATTLATDNEHWFRSRLSHIHQFQYILRFATESPRVCVLSRAYREWQHLVRQSLIFRNLLTGLRTPYSALQCVQETFRPTCATLETGVNSKTFSSPARPSTASDQHLLRALS